MFNPRTTYRLQFHKDFNFKSFEKIIPYLQKIGVSTIYASPVFRATPGSTHGYDVTDPHIINPEIGTYEQLVKLKNKLKNHNMQWIQDIVPNHMAYHPDNSWLMDVLENGPQSIYKDFFDITWTSELYKGKVMVPFLGAPLDEVIQNKELKVEIQPDKLYFKYYDNLYPLHLRSYITILNPVVEKSKAVKVLLEQAELILKVEDPKDYSSQFSEFKKQFSSLIKKEAEGKLIKKAVKDINNSAVQVQSISDEQVYQLCFWQETNSQINFRRFFTINGLICLNVQNEGVFDHYHQFIKKLYDEGIINGLRVDHVDGMYDPSKYLEQLRELAGDEAYIVVEKILEHDEELPEKWPVQGSTGYAFLSLVNNILSNNSSYKHFNDFYSKLTGNNRSVDERVREKKEKILYNQLAGELDNLHDLFLEQGLADDKDLKKISPEDLKKTIAEFLILCPVYRYYGNSMPLEKQEVRAIKDLLKKIRQNNPDLSAGADLLEKVFIRNPSKNKKKYNQKAIHFYQRLMQFTGPLMAKGVEDTLMYTYSRFIGHNEVGDSPGYFGITKEEFHNKMLKRQEKWPLAMNTTSTHDTKRGEDVRSRLNVLTDLYESWFAKVNEWQKINKELKNKNAPDANDEYFIYQTIVGAYPMPGADMDDFEERLGEYLPKALREAKRHSNWTDPDEDYENSTVEFARALIKKDSAFIKGFKDFHRRISDFGIIDSLSQLTLKYTCPGIPDLYQGCELWDLSMVDPDNRRPVDYGLREKMLDKLEKEDGKKGLLKSLWKERYSGKIKLWLTKLLLELRKQDVCNGEYIPLKVKGKYKDHVLSYCRRNKNEWLFVAIPLNIARLAEQEGVDANNIDWSDTRIKLPDDAPQEWMNPVTGDYLPQGKNITVGEIFAELPISIATGNATDKNERRAGVLLHITSLPSKFGVGDLGPEAYAFADFLQRSHQSFWQILPLNPTGSGASFSPYSSNSSMAGNTLLISPELLVKDKLLKREDIKPHFRKLTGKAQFDVAEAAKAQLLEEAYATFKKSRRSTLHKEFADFIEKENFWLDDYSLFVVIKEHLDQKPWYEWADKFKLRDKKTLREFKKDHEESIDKVKWSQFIFFRQWRQLKSYCNKKRIDLFGDLPFYISHDSVDVWAHPEIFKIDDAGKMKGIAGVPPDYFNENGQLWGMPVFRWKKLKKQDYRWWVQRIRKNMELFDLLRLDHFRAFSDFWEVPAGEETAVHGKWKNGPGKKIFKALQKELGELPFIAEDLGDINQAVYDLRDNFDLPGMKVIQFSFGNDLQESPHIPHNYTPDYIAYTGTHDNNTTIGWYRKDIGKTERKNLELYTGIEVNEKNVHEVLIRQVYSSVAKIVIVPMQDILGLDEKHRMNMPATTEKNWVWQMLPDQLKPKTEKWLKSWTEMYNRY